MFDCCLNNDRLPQSTDTQMGDSRLMVTAPNVSIKSSASITAASVSTITKTSLIESVLHTAASLLASLVLGVDLKACNSRYFHIFIWILNNTNN